MRGVPQVRTTSVSASSSWLTGTLRWGMGKVGGFVRPIENRVTQLIDGCVHARVVDEVADLGEQLVELLLALLRLGVQLRHLLIVLFIGRLRRGLRVLISMVADDAWIPNASTASPL